MNVLRVAAALALCLLIAGCSFAAFERVTFSSEMNPETLEVTVELANRGLRLRFVVVRIEWRYPGELGARALHELLVTDLRDKTTVSSIPSSSFPGDTSLLEHVVTVREARF